MKTFRLLILFLALIVFNTSSSAQEKEKRIIKDVTFEANKIILNKKLAYNYLKDGNSFSISNLTGEEIIKGEITSLGEGKFSSIITFEKIGKQFSNDKMIGRNALIFALCDNNVIQNNFELDESKLNEFLEKYNQLK